MQPPKAPADRQSAADLGTARAAVATARRVGFTRTPADPRPGWRRALDVGDTSSPHEVAQHADHRHCCHHTPGHTAGHHTGGRPELAGSSRGAAPLLETTHHQAKENSNMSEAAALARPRPAHRLYTTKSTSALTPSPTPTSSSAAWTGTSPATTPRPKRPMAGRTSAPETANSASSPSPNFARPTPISDWPTQQDQTS